MTNRTPSPRTSPKATTTRLVDALPFGFLSHHLREEVPQNRRGSQRALVATILQDQEQFRLLQQAMQQQQCRTSMSLTQSLHGLLQDRINDMEDSQRRRSRSSTVSSVSPPNSPR